jgi:O-antigen/teichoic acid export membrane protein
MTANNTFAGTDRTESIRTRYAATLAVQFIQLLASVATAGVVPRALGPASFGNLNFILNTASTIRGFLDPSTSQAFFTFSSQERRSGSLTKLYAVVLLVQIIITCFLIAAFSLFDRINLLWPGQLVDQIVWVTILEWSIFITASLRQLGDSKGLTIHSQAIILITAFINVAGLLGLNAFGYLNFYTYIWLNLFTSLLIGAGLVYWLLIVNKDITWVDTLRSHVREYLARWWRYASPLIVFEYYNPLVGYVSTYLLQRWYGSVEQGYFALSFKWSAIVLVFTSSALLIFWREIANAMSNGEYQRAGNVYLRFTHLLFFLSLMLCLWLSFSSRFLVNILVGDEYLKAVPVLMVMAYYPLAQTYGQINVAALKAVERTTQVRNLGVLFSIPDLLLNYFLLAAPNAPVPGLGLGAMGVALRMVVYSLLNLQVYEWTSHRIFGLNYFATLRSKFLVALALVVCALLAISGLGTLLERQGTPILVVFGTTSITFFLLVGVISLIWPQLMGVSRAEVLESINKGIAFVVKSVSKNTNEN